LPFDSLFGPLFLPRMFVVFVAQCDRSQTFPNLIKPYYSNTFIHKVTDMCSRSRPMKKKGGTLAGIPRASGEGKSPTGNGAFAHGQVCDFCISISTFISILARPSDAFASYSALALDSGDRGVRYYPASCLM
jgi:hypothetical protein